MTSLRETIAPQFPDGAVLPGFRIGENQRVFSLKLTPAEQARAAIVELDRDDVIPAGERRCDGLVISRHEGTPALRLTFVELKSTDTRHGLEQLLAAYRWFCRRGARQRHDGVSGRLGEGISHGQKAAGLVVSPNGLPLLQQRRMAVLEKQGLLVYLRKRAEGWTLADLERLGPRPS